MDFVVVKNISLKLFIEHEAKDFLFDVWLTEKYQTSYVSNAFKLTITYQ